MSIQPETNIQTKEQIQNNTPSLGKALRVSVIIPTHNEQLHIEECVESLLSQTLSPDDYELIVVDDGSKDRTPQILKNYTIRYPGRVKLFHQQHGGPALARNLGAGKALGKIFAFLDGDMYFAPDFLEKLISPIEAGETIGSFTLDEFVANAANIWARSWCVCYYLPVGRRVPENLTERESNVFRAIRKEDFWSVGGFDSAGYHDDRSVSQKLGKTAQRVDGATCYHYNPGSVGEVFASAIWVGKSEDQPRTLKEWLRRSPPGSLKRGIARAMEEREPFYVVFDQVYSFGIILGMFRRQALRGGHAR